MKITIAIVMISTIQFAAIKSVSTIDDSASNDIHEIGLDAEVSAQLDDSFLEMIDRIQRIHGVPTFDPAKIGRLM